MSTSTTLSSGRTVTSDDYPVGSSVTIGSRPYDVDDTVVAVAFEGDEVYDLPMNLDTALTMSNQGYVCLAVSGTEHASQEEVQDALDSERDRAVDCFGEGHLK